MARILVNATHGKEDAERATLPFILDNGGQVWACGACTKPRGITQAHLIPAARSVTADNVVEHLASGASTLSF
jgi:hypothetical protein